MCWKIVRKLIDERTAQKFNFISGKDDIKELVLSKIHPSQLEVKFGGTAENIPDEIDFPFFLPSETYQIDDRNKSQIVSEEEYIELANNNKLVVISPYLISEGKIKMDIVNGTKNIFNEGEVKYNDKGNPIVNDIEYFECQSSNSKLELEEEDNKQFSDENENIKLYGRRNRGNNNDINGASDSGTNEINTVFEPGEERTNCCKCSACSIF
jgi:hypothetical protein